MCRCYANYSADERGDLTDYVTATDSCPKWHLPLTGDVMETLSALLALSVDLRILRRNVPVIWSFDFVRQFNKLLNEQMSYCWFETPRISCELIVMQFTW